MVSFELFFLSIIMMAILGCLTARAYRSNLRLRTAILGATLLHEMVFVVFPVWYSLVTDFALEGMMAMSVKPEDLLVVMLGEAIFVALFGVGISLGSQRIVQGKQEMSLSSGKDRIFLSLLIGAGLLIYVIAFVDPPVSVQEMIMHAEGRYYDTNLGMLWAWFEGFFRFPSVVASSFVLISEKKRYSSTLRLMGLTVLVLISAQALSMGIRGRVLLVASLLTFVGFLKRRMAPMYVALVLVLCMLPLFVFLGGPYRSIYFSAAGRGTTTGDLLNSLAQEIGKAIGGRSAYSFGMEGFIFEFAKRSQGPRNSVVLYRLYEDGSSPGFRPLAGAIVSLIPRVIWPGKWQAGSSDTTTYGAAAYLVRRLGYGAPAHNMGPYLASAHAYWEGGWSYLVLVGLATGLFWNLLLRWCAQSGMAISAVIALSFLSGVLSSNLLTALQPLYDLARIFWMVVFPVVIFRRLIDMTSAMNASVTEY